MHGADVEQDWIARGPMRATPGRLPVDHSTWVWELSWPGVRTMLSVGDGITLVDEAGESLLDHHPEFEALAEIVHRRRVILDGVIVRVDDAGRVDGRSGSRRRDRRPSTTALRTAPVSFRVVDLLALDDHDLRWAPYHTRRRLLTSLGLDLPPLVQVSTHHHDLPRAAESARQQGVLGIIAKSASAPYRPGEHDWIELSLLRSCEAVIGGWVPAEPAGDQVGALLLGAHDQARNLTYVGRVTTGFTDATRRALTRLMHGLAADTCPFTTGVPRSQARLARWVRPTVVADLEHRGISAKGLLKRPSWRGVRTDVDPLDPAWAGSLRLHLAHPELPGAGTEQRTR